MFRAFKHAAEEALDIDPEMVTFQHAFSCEKEPLKQKFIHAVCPSVPLHPDALDPCPHSARFVSAGFPCDDASPLHPCSSSEKHRMCVAEAWSWSFHRYQEWIDSDRIDSVRIDDLTQIGSDRID